MTTASFPGRQRAPGEGPEFTPRSLLFVPGSRPDMVAKVGRWRPDAMVVDLEDAVPPAGKESARHDAVSAVAALGSATTVALVRINPPGSPWFGDDLHAVAASAAQGVVLPKYASPDDLAAVRSGLPAGALVVVGLETAQGVADCRRLLTHGVDAVYFGAEDYIADLGGRRTDDGAEVLYARSRVMLAARLAGAGAIDQAVMSIRDDARFLADAAAGRSMGYTGKICVHPAQVALAHQVFSPSAAEVEHARQVLQTLGDAGVATVHGEMVDDVHIRMARLTLARARAQPGAD